jgi:hypothetical protein
MTKNLGRKLSNAKLFAALFGMPEVILRLLSKPTFCRRAEGNGQPHRHLGTDPGSTIQYRGQSFATYPQRLCRFRDTYV